MVGAIIGWFFLGLLALLLLVLLVPTTVFVRYDTGVFTLRVRVLFVVLRFFPARPRRAKKPKKEKPAKAEKTKDETAGDKKGKKKKTLGDMVRLVKRLSKAGWAALRVFGRHLRVRDVRLVLPVHAADAAATALRVGRLQWVIGVVRALLDGRIHIKYRQLTLIPDFTGRAGAPSFSCKADFCLGIMLVMGVVFLREYLKAGRRAYSRADYVRAAKARQAAAHAEEKDMAG